MVTPLGPSKVAIIPTEAILYSQVSNFYVINRMKFLNSASGVADHLTRVTTNTVSILLDILTSTSSSLSFKTFNIGNISLLLSFNILLEPGTVVVTVLTVTQYIPCISASSVETNKCFSRV